MSADLSQEGVLGTVAGMITEVVGDELELDGPISMTTSFNRDLELESIEFVALAEMLQDHYGEELDFVAWLSNKELDEIISLSVGDLVEFVIQCRS
jgi:acyl carrier protein